MSHNYIDLHDFLKNGDNLEISRYEYDTKFKYTLRYMLGWDVWREDINENGIRLYSGSDFNRALEAFINDGADERN